MQFNSPLQHILPKQDQNFQTMSFRSEGHDSSMLLKRSASMTLLQYISRQPELLKLSDSATSIRGQAKSKNSDNSSIESLNSKSSSKSEKQSSSEDEIVTNNIGEDFERLSDEYDIIEKRIIFKDILTKIKNKRVDELTVHHLITI